MLGLWSWLDLWRSSSVGLVAVLGVKRSKNPNQNSSGYKCKKKRRRVSERMLTRNCVQLSKGLSPSTWVPPIVPHMCQCGGQTGTMLLEREKNKICSGEKAVTQLSLVKQLAVQALGACLKRNWNSHLSNKLFNIPAKLISEAYSFKNRCNNLCLFKQKKT